MGAPPPAVRVWMLRPGRALGDTAMSIEQYKRAEQRFVDEVINQGRMDSFDELISPDWRERTDDSFGVERLRELIAAWRGGMPDLHATIELIAAEGDLAAVRLRVEGTHTGSYLGLEPTGKKVAGTLAYFDRFDGSGRVVESWTESGSKGFYEQICGRPYEMPVAAG